MYSCVSGSSPSSGFSTTGPVAPIHSFSSGTLPHGEWSANRRWWIQLCKVTTQPRQVSITRCAAASMAERIDAARQRLLESRVVNQARGLRVDFAECSMSPPENRENYVKLGLNPVRPTPATTGPSEDSWSELYIIRTYT